MKTLIRLLPVLVLLTALTGCQALAQGEQMTPADFLAYLLTGPGIGIFISIGLEKFPFAKRLFDKIPDLEWKRMAVLGLSVILPTAALLVGWQLGYFEISDITVFNVLAAAWEAFTTSTVLHGFIREKQG